MMLMVAPMSDEDEKVDVTNEDEEQLAEIFETSAEDPRDDSETDSEE